MPKDKDLMQQAIANLQRQGKAAPKSPVEGDLMARATKNLRGTPQEENIWAAPDIVQNIPALKSLVGVAQELSEFATAIPRAFGVPITTPKVVETGFGEKAGAGILEYILGGAGVKALPAIGKGFQALGKVPAVGRALASPFSQRAIGMGAMGALEDPEHPVRGAALSAGMGAGAEIGFKVPGKAVDFMAKSKWSPFHGMMMPHIKREFNEFLSGTAKKLGLTAEHDVDKSMFGTLGAKYKKATDAASALYDRASGAFKSVKLPVYWNEGLRGRTMPLIKDIQESYGKAPDAFGIKINRTMKELENKIDDPIAFRRKIHSAERDAVRAGNHDLLDSLQNIGKSYDKSLGRLAGKTKDPALSKALISLRKADTYFKDNVVPFRYRASVKTEGGKRKAIPTKFFQAHSKNSSKNLGKKISGDIEDLEHISKVAPEIKEHLAFNHLKGGVDKPEKFIQEYSALTKEQKASIFTKEEIARFDKFKRIYSKNPKAFEEGKSLIPKIAGATIGGGATAAAAHVLPFAGVTTPIALGGLAAGLGATGASKVASMIPAVREAYIGGTSMIPKSGIVGTRIIPTSKKGLRDIVMGAILGETKE